MKSRDYILINSVLIVLSIGSILFSVIEVERIYVSEPAMARSLILLVGVLLVLLGLTIILLVSISKKLISGSNDWRDNMDKPESKSKAVILIGPVPIILGFGRKALIIALSVGLFSVLILLIILHFG